MLIIAQHEIGFLPMATSQQPILPYRVIATISFTISCPPNNTTATFY